MIQRFALMVGAMKTGTTALYYTLKQHPQVAACREKEPAFWSDPDRGPEDMAAYRELWDWEDGRHEWALEASTSYTKAPKRVGPALITSRLDEEFRFIYMVRNPLDRIRSQYLHSLAEGWIARPIYEELQASSVRISNYHFQLEPYVSAHGREKIHVVQYEAFRADPCAAARGVSGFLGLDPDFTFVDPGGRNTSTVYRSMLLIRVLKRMRALPDPVEPRAFEFVRPSLMRAAFLKRVGEEQLAEAELELERSITPTSEQAELVRSELADDLERFHQEWGIDPWADPESRG